MIEKTDRLIRFIESDHVAICRISEVNHLTKNTGYRPAEPHRTQHYKGRDDLEWDIDYIHELTPMNKTAGSDLVAAWDIKRELERLRDE